MIPALIGLAVISAILAFLLVKKIQMEKHSEMELKQTLAEFESFKSQYKDIVNVDKELVSRQSQLKTFNQQIDALTSDFSQKKEQLNTEFQAKRNVYESLLGELSILEENLENISFGLYKPHFDYKTSEEFKQRIEVVREKQKNIIKDERATHCPVNWEVGGSKSEGQKMTKNYAKLMLRAFNGECDAAIAKVNWSNIGNMEARIDRAFEAINKLGSTHRIVITKEYFETKVEELRLEFELEEKLHKEKEEQRQIREQMREEEKALREMEKVRKDAEEEEERFQKALDKAKAEVEKARGQEVDELNQRINQLEVNLRNAHDLKERAISQAQLTKSGHVYIISNIGSFGDDVFKVGMTRRLEPLDRVNELGDASVPFDFDVHGMIYSDNAPELENAIHKKLESKRMNLVNYRAEFFKTSLREIEQIVREQGLNVELTQVAEAKEYRETLSLRDAKAKGGSNVDLPKSEIEKRLERFPSSL